MTSVFKRLIAAALAAILSLTCLPLVAAADSTAAIGDINADGKLNIKDALQVYYYVNGKTPLTDDELSRADYSGDGKINIKDALQIYYLVLGAISGPDDELPPDEPSTAVPIRDGITDESVYMSNIKVTNTCTGKVFTGETKEKLQMAVAEIVKYEAGMSTFGEKNDETWKVFAVAAYTLLARHCFNGASYDIYMGSDINLNNSTDKRIYDAVGAVLGIKVAYDDPSRSPYNQLCQMFYSASSAGVTCTTLNAWGYTDLEYMPQVESYYDNTEWIAHCSAGIDSYIHSFDIPMTELLECVGKWMDEDVIYYDTKDGEFSLYATKQDGPYWAYSNLYYFDSNNQKKYVSGVSIYHAINRYHPVIHCYSHAITVTGEKDGVLSIETKGNGHGIGLSQYGVAGYANEAGWTYDRILAHYLGITETSAWGLVGPKW